MRFRTTTLLVSEGLVSHCDVRFAACLRANVRPAQTRVGTCMGMGTLEAARTMTLLLEYFLRSVPTTKQHVARQTPPSAPPNIICCSCTSSSSLTVANNGYYATIL